MPLGLRRLLLALAFPALLLPDGVTLCLCRLIGEPAVRATCTHCCCDERSSDAASTPFPSSARGRTDCWLTTPAAKRSLDSASRKLFDASLAAASSVVAIAPRNASDLLAPFAESVVARSARTLHPPPIVPLSLPLRL